jgi:hypothetical protein
MPIRRPSYMVLKRSKKGSNLKLAYESEHQWQAEDYQRQWGGVLVVGMLEDMDVEIGGGEENEQRRGRKTPVMTEPYIQHEGPVPPPPNAVAPFMIRYGEDLNRVYVALDDSDDEPERIVQQLPPNVLADVLAALEEAGPLPEE